MYSSNIQYYSSNRYVILPCSLLVLKVQSGQHRVPGFFFLTIIKAVFIIYLALFELIHLIQTLIYEKQVCL